MFTPVGSYRSAAVGTFRPFCWVRFFFGASLFAGKWQSGFPARLSTSGCDWKWASNEISDGPITLRPLRRLRWPIQADSVSFQPSPLAIGIVAGTEQSGTSQRETVWLALTGAHLNLSEPTMSLDMCHATCFDSVSNLVIDLQ